MADSVINGAGFAWLALKDIGTFATQESNTSIVDGDCFRISQMIKSFNMLAFSSKVSIPEFRRQDTDRG